MSFIREKDHYLIDDKEGFLISGEFHYFRVPKKDWRTRLELWREIHGNCVATYVPWSIHEPQEGRFCWGDVENRDIVSFLTLCRELNISVIIRPGPLQYSELVGDGIPAWIFEKYPQIRAQKQNGEYIPFPSYNHPLFLEKARRYFREFANVVRPFTMENGGPICLVQVDNEVMGGQIWKGTIDYNRETVGFGDVNGRYATWLRRKYTSISELNEAYGTAYASFAEVFPAEWDSSKAEVCRCSKDYFDFYISMTGDYLRTLSNWLEEDGIRECICHNSANPVMNGLFEDMIPGQKENFLLGSDHYYNLNQFWAQNSPTPQYALNILFSCEQLRNMGMPPTVMELPGGSPSDFPPILPEDIEACYLTNVAMGMRGLNIYVYTGGLNFEHTGETCDIYDYHALVHADGSINDTCHAAQKVFGFLENNSWLQTAGRVTSVNVAYENEWFRSDNFGLATAATQSSRVGIVRNGILYSLMCSPYAPGMTDIRHSVPGTDKPLILCSADAMSRQAQENVVAFLENGGSLLLFPTAPTMDEDYRPCTLLKDYIGLSVGENIRRRQPVVYEEDGLRVYGLDVKGVFSEGTSIARLANDGDPVVVEKYIGNGHVIFASFEYQLTLTSQIQLLCRLLERLGAKETLSHSNPHVFTSVFRDGTHTAVFLMNLYSGKNTTDIKGCGMDEDCIRLNPMEVRVLLNPDNVD